MTTDHYSRVYAKQEYLTPGAAETVSLLAEAARLDADAAVVEVAVGKGEAACALAATYSCRVVGVDRWAPFLRYTAAKVEARGLEERVNLLRADGRYLPVPDRAADTAYCIGGPSIVGLEPCLAELARVVRGGGVVAVSDIIWRTTPDQLGPEWGWVARQLPRIGEDDYAALLTAAGLTVEAVVVHPRAAWDAYYAPMRAVARDERAAGNDAFADEMEAGIEVEERAIDSFWDYATFIARKP